MKEFFAVKLHIANDGIIHINEVIAAAIVLVLIILVIVLATDLICEIRNRMPGRKKTIFSHRKNRYKSRRKINFKNLKELHIKHMSYVAPHFAGFFYCVPSCRSFATGT